MQTPPTNTQNQTKPLSRQQIKQMSEAYGRLLDIREATIKSPTHEAEAKGLVEFLSTEFLSHAAEFIGVWVAIRDEYEPLVNLAVRLTERVVAIKQLREQQASAPVPAPAEESPLLVTK